MSIDLPKVTALSDKYGNIARLELGGKVIWGATGKVTWQKYSCTVSTASTWTRTTPNTTTTFTITAPFGRSLLAYTNYTFSSSSGISGIGETSATITPASTTSTATGLLQGRYYIQQQSTEHTAYRVTSVTSTSKGSSALTITCRGTIAAKATKPTTYNKGSTSYGTVQATEGALPENGTLLAGSATGTYCVVQVGGTNYYYVKA